VNIFHNLVNWSFEGLHTYHESTLEKPTIYTTLSYLSCKYNNYWALLPKDTSQYIFHISHLLRLALWFILFSGILKVISIIKNEKNLIYLNFNFSSLITILISLSIDIIRSYQNHTIASLSMIMIVCILLWTFMFETLFFWPQKQAAGACYQS